ncbi:prolyl oligopeptidase family serine peptidase [Salinibacter ruber]|uniref:prolyl oligopeptidase family serine peptidase n=1 Tax=Salinibacter ruber TaxID=146919 RepID=UPI0021680F30|nr:prolyl oligopeptidase family serine peptidase [Salinibacter ruber]MCS3756478.1 dipeptidyl aminopeptidase/acylaminoacyl peptidase [Salinibacter ruber]MCS3953972.1 dipeptidyl aminopeptidase/acylaminoacyl peptidase [Salinibacter ruber]MCS4087726.1 dipeptidyl aminopeptidase/acylaminoacyl peptidase [Salinibacter ruber]
MTRFSSLLLALSVLLLPLRPAQGQPAERTSSLTVEQIMQAPETWIGDWPTNARWHESGQALYFNWNPGGDFPSDSLYKVSRSGGAPQKVSPAERRSNPPTFDGWHHGEHVYTDDFSRKVYAADGDLYLYNRETDTQTRLTDTPAREGNPRFGLEEDRVLFERDDNLFSVHLSTGQIRQLTDVQSGREPQEGAPSPRERFLEEQQLELFETLRERNEEEEQADEARERDREADDPPPPFYTGDAEVSALRMDPTERFVTIAQQSQPDAADPTQVIDYVTESGQADVRRARPKVGIPPGDFALHVQDLKRDTTIAVNLHQLPGAYDVPAYRQEQGAELDSSEAKRALYSYGPYWSADGDHGVLVVRADNNKDRWIARLDPETGDLTVLDRQHDTAWIGGPGISAYGGPGNVGWMPDGEHFYFQSEATGYSHLYTVDVETGETTQLTSGDFEVLDARLSQDGSTWTLTTNRHSPHQQHVERMPADGGDITRLTQMTGTHDAVLSPDGTRLATLYSTTNQPADLYLKDATADADPVRITESPTDEWAAYDWRMPELTRFEASDGVEVPAHVFRPDNPNGAAVFFVHGAGYLQNVLKDFPPYFREYMFHNMLTDLGYTVVDVDYRGSAGYGRDWRTAVYRHMGGRDLQDYVDAAKWVGDTYGIPAERRFIYGGSYGGFMTLMALFTEPEHFGGGAALRSVTDWAHYNDVYTSNILNTPQTDSLAYARSSPIYHAEGLEDPLLMPHGLVDTNVQPQDIFRLTQRLIELGKENWELAIYPVEGHGFEEPSSWTDEYRRIFELIQESVGPERPQK